jgi:hypothetical protein
VGVFGSIHTDGFTEVDVLQAFFSLLARALAVFSTHLGGAMAPTFTHLTGAVDQGAKGSRSHRKVSGAMDIGVKEAAAAW